MDLVGFAGGEDRFGGFGGGILLLLMLLLGGDGCLEDGAEEDFSRDANKEEGLLGGGV